MWEIFLQGHILRTTGDALNHIHMTGFTDFESPVDEGGTPSEQGQQSHCLAPLPFINKFLMIFK
jgi:hypothetical protein